MPKDNIARDFIIPALERAVRYDRATGYFSSQLLLHIVTGIRALSKNGGRIRIITSPKLSDKDIEAIREGYDRRHVIEQALLREFNPPSNKIELNRLTLLANLISSGLMDIKISFMDDLTTDCMFHPKFGLIYDKNGDCIYFNGSMNETSNGYLHNWESIDLLNSWENVRNVRKNQEIFENLWNNTEPGVTVCDFPEVAINRLIEYKREGADPNPDDEATLELPNELLAVDSKYFKKPEKIKLRPYQIDAINKWEGQGYIGIFNMATGTGKTLTALGALERICNKHDRGLAIIIVCPLQHLVEQWVEDIKQFSVQPIIGHSQSVDKNWKRTLDRSIRIFNYHWVEGPPTDSNYFCLVTTNASFTSKDVQTIISRIEGDIVLVVDEVHNIGSSRSLNSLNTDIRYRLGLSATVDRYNDPNGTKAIREYFGEDCINYGLKEAIVEKMLTEYYYYPIPCFMTPHEYEKYTRMNTEMEQIQTSNMSTSRKLIELQAIKVNGARLISSMEEKFTNLQKYVTSYREEKYILVYCGDARVYTDEQNDGLSLEEHKRIVDEATRILGKKLGMRVSQFTYLENIKDRQHIKEDFSEGRIQALIAIRCLDEGVNIPAIRTAFITSSSENPKEYVQRRGRVLRNAPGKDFATIFDFVAFPMRLDEVRYGSDETNTKDLRFLAREINRMCEFSDLSRNPEDTEKLLRSIEEAYGISDVRGYADECR